jgi:hypothetical protein
MKRKITKRVASAMFMVLLAFALGVLRHSEYMMPEIHTEGGALMPTTNVSLYASGNTSSMTLISTWLAPTS